MYSSKCASQRMANELTIDSSKATDMPRAIGGGNVGASPGEEAVPKELNQSFAKYDQQVTINNIQLGCLLGMILMPAGVVLDFFTYPKQLDVIGEFFLLRL